MLFEALRGVQPLVVLFSLAVVVASFLKPTFPDASTWSLASALGFGWALLFSMVFRLVRPAGAVYWFSGIYHLLIDIGVLLGFVSLGATLFELSQVSGLLSAAYEFLVCEAASLAIAPSVYRFWTRSLAREPGAAGRGSWILGDVALAFLVVAIASPPFLFWTSSAWISGKAISSWAFTFGPLALALAIRRMVAEARRAMASRGS